MLSTKDGFEYVPQGGLRKGLKSAAVISPDERRASETELYDAIVVGAGYAGLIAASDLTKQGRKVLLLEARDRIGGRTFTVHEHEKALDLGGTWVHWFHLHAWSEIIDYGLEDSLADSGGVFPESLSPTVVIDGTLKTLDPQDPESSVLSKICDFDGMGEAFKTLDKMSVQDRVDQMQLSQGELVIFKSQMAMMVKGTLQDIAFSELVRWYAISGGTSANMAIALSKWKLRDGQTSLALAMFRETESIRNLSYRFSAPVCSVETTQSPAKQLVRASTTDGKTYQARQVICALPLNVLQHVKFSPPLGPTKAEAIQQGHNNLMVKLYAERKGRRFRNWYGFHDQSGEAGFPFMSGEGFSKDGHDSLIFHTVSKDYGETEKNPEKAVRRVEQMHPDLKVVRLMGHDWSSDPYSQGGWIITPPNFTTKYLSALQAAHGYVHFAGSDIAHVWRGFIDGALESGKAAAAAVSTALR